MTARTPTNPVDVTSGDWLAAAVAATQATLGTPHPVFLVPAGLDPQTLATLAAVASRFSFGAAVQALIASDMPTHRPWQAGPAAGWTWLAEGLTRLGPEAAEAAGLRQRALNLLATGDGGPELAAAAAAELGPVRRERAAYDLAWLLFPSDTTAGSAAWQHRANLDAANDRTAARKTARRTAQDGTRARTVAA